MLFPPRKWEETIMSRNPVRGPSDWVEEPDPTEEPVKETTEEPVEELMELGGIQVYRNKYPVLQ